MPGMNRHKTDSFWGFCGKALICVAWVYFMTWAEEVWAERTEQRAAELVRQLGSPVYAEREEASRELSRYGVNAREPLVAALHDPDAEIRFRARAILAVIRESDLAARIESFAADVDGQRKVTLPGWNYFRKQVGEDRLSRGLFVEMQKAEPAILELIEQGDFKEATESLAERCQSLMEMLQTPNARARGQITTGSVATFLLVAAAPDVGIDDQVGVQLNNFIYQSNFQTAARNSNQSTLLKKMLTQWITKESDSTVGYYNLMLAFNFELPEGLEIALRLLNGGGGQTHMRQYALLAVGRFGAQKHISVVEPYLNDATICFTQQVNNRQIQVQVRDIALGVLVKMSGLDMKEYGFEGAQPHPQMLFNPGSLSFADPAKRDAAIKKWRAWSADRLSKKAG